MDCKIYREFNSDLKNHTDLELENHFNVYGKNENRIYNLETLKKHPSLQHFDLDYYKENNLDLKFESDDEYLIDFVKYRTGDNRRISSNYNKDNYINKSILISNNKMNSRKLTYFMIIY